jgi:hypothetical protein
MLQNINVSIHNIKKEGRLERDGGRKRVTHKRGSQ